MISLCICLQLCEVFLSYKQYFLSITHLCFKKRIYPFPILKWIEEVVDKDSNKENHEREGGEM